MIYLYLSIAFIVGYLIGNVNFARIFSWAFAKKDITTVGSKNPGTMNMLRTRGIGEAFLTLIFEAIKSGAPALAGYFLFEHFFTGFGNWAFLLIAFGAIVGHCFPVFYKFKGGKGVACTFGLFVFYPNFWWISLIVFVGCFLLFLFIQYGFIVSITFILTMTVVATCIFTIYNFPCWIALVVILWLNFALVLFMHRSNIKRLCTGTENEVNLREKLFKKKKAHESMAMASEDETELGEK